MGDAYPELVAEREEIARWVGDEEESFGRTLERGTELLRATGRARRGAGTSGSTPPTPSSCTTPTASPTT